MSRLVNGQALPTLQVELVGGGTLSLPEDLNGSFAVVLLYRGSWCPYCAAQLAAFSRAKDAFDEVGLKVVALSVDDEQTSSAFAAKLKLTFPLGHSADAGKLAEVLGAYTSEDSGYLQSTGFVLSPSGSILTAVYSSGAIGRLTADDVLGFVRYVQQSG
jgi:peroxiredoxin